MVQNHQKKYQPSTNEFIAYFYKKIFCFLPMVQTMVQVWCRMLCLWCRIEYIFTYIYSNLSFLYKSTFQTLQNTFFIILFEILV